MAYFGAPLEVPQAATQAVSCAVAMQQRLAEMRSQAATPIGGMRISVNTGEAIIGNIGSDKRMDFTVIGDVVNVTARLLETCRERDADIIIAASTHREVEGHFAVAPGPAVVLRGRQEPTGCYQVLVP
jgi:adenylate cyclase